MAEDRKPDSNAGPEQPQVPQRASWTERAQPVFLVGCPRSGTTWVQALLAEHPAIVTGPEGHFFAAFAAAEQCYRMAPDRRSGLSGYLSEADFYALMGDLFWRVNSRLPVSNQEVSYLLEKSPGHCFNAEFILRTFPKARFIHLLRDPRSVAASLLRVAATWGRAWAPRTIDAAAEFWWRHVTASRKIASLVPTPRQFLEVRYEEFRQEPHRQLALVWQWLGVEFTEPMVSEAVAAHQLDAARSDELFRSIRMPASANAGAGDLPAYPQGFIGNGAADANKATLSEWQRARLEHALRSVLPETGYLPATRPMSLWGRLASSPRVRKLVGREPL